MEEKETEMRLWGALKSSLRSSRLVVNLRMGNLFQEWWGKWIKIQEEPGAGWWLRQRSNEETPELLVGKSLCGPRLKEPNSQQKSVADTRHGTGRKLQAWTDKRKVGIRKRVTGQLVILY